MPAPEFNDESPLDDEQVALIQQLRTEVLQLKDCIAKYAIQALAFVAAAVGIVLKFQAETFADGHKEQFRVLLGCAGIPLLLPLLAVSRTAIHKLGTINRNLGYELHLQRSRSLPSSAHGWRPSYSKVGWEEAMRAWRVVQATLFGALCKTEKNGAYRPFADPRKAVPPQQGYFWYDIDCLVREASKEKGGIVPRYHAGNYVRKMLQIIHYSMVACFLPLPLALAGSMLTVGSIQWTPAHTIVSALAAVFVGFLVRGIEEDRVRLAHLESGILSIHSCAIIWRAVVVAHYRAVFTWRQCRYEGHQPAAAHNGYTHQLTLRALQLAANPFRIHEWTDGARADRIRHIMAIKVRDINNRISTATTCDLSSDGKGVALIVNDSKIGSIVQLMFDEHLNVSVNQRHTTKLDTQIVRGVQVNVGDQSRVQNFLKSASIVAAH